MTTLPPKALLQNKAFYDDNRPDGWNPGEQHKVFIDLLKISDYAHKSFENASVLDVGCGTGKLLSILGRNGISRYVGIDVFETAISQAKTSHEPVEGGSADFIVGDFLAWKPAEEFDFVFASGALSLNVETFGIDNHSFLYEMVSKMWSLTRYGLVFNFLSNTTINPGTSLFFYKTEKVIKLCNDMAPSPTITKESTLISGIENVHLYLYNAS